MYKIKMDNKVLYYPGDEEAVVIEPELNLQTGYAGELSLKVPPKNPLYTEIRNRKSMISVYRNKKEIFYGEVRTREKDWNNNQPVKAVGALTFLADSIQPQKEYHNISPRGFLDALLTIHNNQVEDRKKIYTGTVTIHDSNDSLYRFTNRETTLEAIRDKLVDRLGGYLRLRHENEKMYLDWISIEEYGKYCEQPIQFGENLLDYSESLTSDDLITALIPLGAAIEQESDENATEYQMLEKNVDITSANGGKNYIYSKEAVEKFGWVWATAKWEDVTVPSNLLRKGTEYLQTAQYETLVLSLTAVDLSEFGQDYDSFEEGDRILCYAKPYGMKKILPVMEMNIPLQQPDQAQLTLGETRQQTYTERTSSSFAKIKKETTDGERIISNQVKTAIDNLTKQMTGAKGGYKLSEYDENGLWIRDLYMDAPDKEKATRLLQVNKDGIGGSSSGYDGPYTIGMTVDGQLIGERLVAGSVKTEALSAECKQYIESKITEGDGETQKAVLKTVTTTLEEMQGQINLRVESVETQLQNKSGNWYGNYVPTSENNPAAAWTEVETKKEHERDIFFDTSTGYAYQYILNGEEYGWQRVKDKDIEAAQSAAESAIAQISVLEGNILSEVSKKYATTDQVQSAINQMADDITLSVSQKYATTDTVSTKYDEAVKAAQNAADQAQKNAESATDEKLKNYVTADDLDEAEIKIEEETGKATDKKLGNYSTTAEMQAAIQLAADQINLNVEKEISDNYCTNGFFENKSEGWTYNGFVSDDTDYLEKHCFHMRSASMRTNTLKWQYTSYGSEKTKIALKVAAGTSASDISVILDDTEIMTIAKTDITTGWKEFSAETQVEKGDHVLQIKVTDSGKDAYITDVKILVNYSEKIESKISVLSDSISSKVSKGDVISEINQTAETVKISAEKINFNGMVTANKYFQILTDGSVKAVSGEIGGWNITGYKIKAKEGNLELYGAGGDGKTPYILIGDAKIQPDGKAADVKYGLHVHTKRAETFDDGTGEFQLIGLSTSSAWKSQLVMDANNSVCKMSSSSKRYKKHVGDLTAEQAEKALDIPVVWFRYKKGYLEKNDYFYGKAIPGFYAEDVCKCIPEAVQINDDGTVEDWNYRILVPIMMKLIQNLYKQKEAS